MAIALGLSIGLGFAPAALGSLDGPRSVVPPWTLHPLAACVGAALALCWFARSVVAPLEQATRLGAEVAERTCSQADEARDSVSSVC